MAVLPDGHPLADYDGDLEGHADHLDAYAAVLDEADAERTQAAMLILTGEDGTDTLPTVGEDVDPRWASLWMLGAHIHHVADAASSASGRQMSMEEAAQDAIAAIREHAGPEEVYD